MLRHASFVFTCERAVRVRSPYSLFFHGGSQLKISENGKEGKNSVRNLDRGRDKGEDQWRWEGRKESVRILNCVIFKQTGAQICCRFVHIR